MKKYATGIPKSNDPNYAENRIKGWVERWGNNDPFNGLSVYLKETNEFVGQVVIGRSDVGNGTSELAYLFFSKFWNQKIGSEVVTAVVNHLAPAIIDRQIALDGVQLKSIVATTRVDHTPSQKILRKAGLETDGKINEKFGAQRYIFEVSAEKLLEMRREARLSEQKAPSPKLGVFNHAHDNNTPTQSGEGLCLQYNDYEGDRGYSSN